MELRKIDSGNFEQIAKLEVEPDQVHFVASNVWSLAEAYATAASGMTALPFGIYENGIPVGFVMFGYDSLDDPDEPPVARENYCLWRFMIDRRYQGRGLGKQALESCLDYLRTFPCGPAAYCWLSYEPENLRAKGLYEKVGFAENGQFCGKEAVLITKL